MPVKFGPKGYTSPIIRRYQNSGTADAEIDAGGDKTPRERRARAFGVVLAIALVFVAAGYMIRSGYAPPVYVANGKIVAKETRTAPDGSPTYVLGITVQLPAGDLREIQVECTAATWQSLQPGDSVIAHYTAYSATGRIVVTGVEPLPAPVEL